MAHVEIWTTAFCPFCFRAKRMLEAKGAAFDEIDVTFKPGKRAEMTARAGGNHSVPQIWIGGAHVGGSDELDALDAEGRLDAMLADAA